MSLWYFTCRVRHHAPGAWVGVTRNLSRCSFGSGAQQKVADMHALEALLASPESPSCPLMYDTEAAHGQFPALYLLQVRQHCHLEINTPRGKGGGPSALQWSFQAVNECISTFSTPSWSAQRRPAEVHVHDSPCATSARYAQSMQLQRPMCKLFGIISWCRSGQDGKGHPSFCWRQDTAPCWSKRCMSRCRCCSVELLPNRWVKCFMT